MALSHVRSTVTPTWAEEKRLIQQGYRRIAGVDEVGRGPLAGPVVAAAVILDPNADLPFYGQLRDSKALSAARREYLAPLIMEAAVAWGIGAAGPEEVDALGIVKANRAAMARAVASLSTKPDHLLVDAVPLPETGIPFQAIIKGDAQCRSIAAASIVAKVTRDQRMVREDAAYPGYGFAAHKGYGTSQHLERLARLGPCPIHRRSFAPVRALVQPLVEVRPSPSRMRGQAAEEAAAGYLEGQGYRVLDRNWFCSWGEIDIVAELGEVIAFVEVRARQQDGFGSAAESITRRKRQHLIMAGQHYLQQRGLDNRHWRIDVIGVRLGPGGMVSDLEHVENAVEGS